MDSACAAAGFNLSRRQWLQQSAIAAGGFALGSTRALVASDDGISRTAEAIHQEVIFKATPKRLYDALTDASQFQKMESFSAAMKGLDVGSHPSKISREPGGAFSLFGDHIIGRRLNSWQINASSKPGGL